MSGGLKFRKRRCTGEGTSSFIVAFAVPLKGSVPPKADIRRHDRHVRPVPKRADKRPKPSEPEIIPTPRLPLSLIRLDVASATFPPWLPRFVECAAVAALGRLRCPTA